MSSSSASGNSNWFFNIEPESPSEGLVGLNPFSKNLFRSVLRKFAGKTTTNDSSSSSSPSTSSSIPSSPPNSEYQKDGAQSQGLVPVEGAVSSFRCGGINFGVHAVEVRQQPNESSTTTTTTEEENSAAIDNNNKTMTTNEKEVTFNISCASLESANHGLCVGLSLADTNRESPMQWDEPNTCFLSCSVDGATFWSEHLGEYGKKVSDKCLFKENNSSTSASNGDQQQPQKYVGKVQMKWNVENGSVSFDVFDESRKEIIANCTRDYFSKKSKYSAESSEEAIKELLPTVAFSTVVNEDMVTLS